MSWQKIYGTMEDNVSKNVAHTSSRRGKVDEVFGSINSEFGHLLNFRCYTTGKHKLIDETRILEKVAFWTEKKNDKKIKAWMDKLKHAREQNKIETESECNSVILNTLRDDKTTVQLNGVTIKNFVYEYIRLINEKDWIGLIRLINKNENTNVLLDAAANGVIGDSF